LPLLEQAVAQVTAMGFVAVHTGAIVRASEAYWIIGQREDAIPLAWRALELSQNKKLGGVQAWAFRLLGEIQAHRDPPEAEQAEASYGQALGLAGELGMRLLKAHCHLGLGKLYAAIGRRAEARIELTAAIALYRAMAMTLWLSQAEATLAQVEGRR
jgi:tetratricopeptide (TPR) repeat protein